MFGFQKATIETFKYYYLIMINMTKTMEQIVADEIEQVRREHGEAYPLYYLNNFRFNLPSDEFAHSYKQNIDIQLKVRDTPHGDFIKKLSKGDDVKAQKSLKLHSPLYLNQTPREFYETIKKVLAEQGMPVAKVKELQRKALESAADRVALYNFIFPAYMQLRKMGYTWQDLCS